MLYEVITPVGTHTRVGDGRAIRGERVLGLEVAVEPAVGETGGGHRLGDAHAVEAALAEQARGGLSYNFV